MQNLKKQRSTFTSSPSSDAPRAFGVPIAPMPDAASEAAAASEKVEGQKAQTTEHGGRHVTPDAAHKPFRLRRTRYRRIITFFVLMFARWIAWEVVLRRLLGEHFVAKRRPNHYRQDSRRFRKVAIEMGGVLIKLGQFVSSRVDILPPEITDELAGLQDQVPVVPFDYIRRTIEREIGPLKEKFAWLNAEPVAAASFGQVHRAQLPNGDRVVVKVQRPNLNDLVHTDLSALAVVARLA